MADLHNGRNTTLALMLSVAAAIGLTGASWLSINREMASANAHILAASARLNAVELDAIRNRELVTSTAKELAIISARLDAIQQGVTRLDARLDGQRGKNAPTE
ncbi:MAG: hypothetical protein IMZ50_08760 [Candidatus Atribacteria bacterium]|nr:hypothetical protein [Candidatus Atribacteria bacterium]